MELGGLCAVRGRGGGAERQEYRSGGDCGRRRGKAGWGDQRGDATPTGGEPPAPPDQFEPPRLGEESPQLRRARELLAMHIHPNDVLDAVRLTRRERQALGVPA